MEQWDPIKYVSSNKNVQELLKMLYDHGSASYDQIKHLANGHVIKQLDQFGLIEYDQSRAFGLTQETVIKQSNYQLSTKGNSWYQLIIKLATLSNDVVIVQISIGDFKKFVNHLNNFLYSDKPEEIKDAYEFLLDDSSGNFYQRSDAKLNHLRDSARRLQTELIKVRNDHSLANAIDSLRKHVNEFSSVSNDILNVLIKEGETIKERLNQLKNLNSSHFYNNIAHHIEGATTNDTTADRIKNNVNRFIDQITKNGVYENYTQKLLATQKILTNINDYLNDIDKNMETKGLLIDLAKQFFNEPSVEKCEEKFNKLMSNKTIHHITTNNIASVNGRNLVMTMPDAKPKPKVKPKIDKKRQQYETDKLEVIELSKQLKQLKLYSKIMQNPIVSGSYDNNSYFAIRQAILNNGSEETLNDPTQYDAFFNQLLERIHRQLEKPDVTPEDIIDYMLAEIEPRRWYELSLFYKRDNNQEIEPLTTQAIADSFSTGERARSYYIPMFALLEIVQSQMNPNAPHILIMDEAFNTIDEKQTKLLLEKIYNSCDLFIATTPGKTLPIVSNSKGSTTLQLQRVTIDGVATVQSFGGIMYEEIA